METVTVDFVEVETAIGKILEETGKIKEKKNELKTLVTNLSEDWKDTKFESYNLYKNSTFNLAKNIEEGATNIDALIELIKTSMQEYKKNEDSGEHAIINIGF